MAFSQGDQVVRVSRSEVHLIDDGSERRGSNPSRLPSLGTAPRPGALSLFPFVFLLGSACAGVDESALDGAPPEAIGIPAASAIELPDAVGTGTQALAVGDKHTWHWQDSFGGNIAAQSHTQRFDQPCNPGFTRTDKTARSDGHGTCEIEWANESDPHDCSIYAIGTTSAGWGSLVCFWDVMEEVLEQRPVAGSCRIGAQRLLCGGMGSDGSCMCDANCLEYGDCCADKATACD